MNLYILPHVSSLTGSYHSTGGLVVIAESLEHAKKIITIVPEFDDDWERDHYHVPAPSPSELDNARVYVRVR